MSELIEYLSLANPFELCSDHFPCLFFQPVGINKDPTVWPDGARPPPKNVFKNNMSLMYSKFQ
jgi:hypothetical protein